MGEYEMKLMDIDQGKIRTHVVMRSMSLTNSSATTSIEHLGIPDTQYDAQVTMPSSEFLRIVRDIKELGESVKIEVTKEGVKFSSEGDIGTAAVTLRPTTATTTRDDSGSESGSEESSDEEESDEDDEEEEEAEVKSEPDEDAAPKKKAGSKKKVVADSDDDGEENGDDEMNGGQENGTQEDRKPVIDFSQDDDEEDENEGSSSKRKRAASQGSDVKPDIKKSKKGKKAAAKEKKQKKKASKAKGKVIKKSKKRDSDEPNRDVSLPGPDYFESDKMLMERCRTQVTIALTQSVSLTFSIKYLLNFAKSTPLSDTVSLHLSAEVPLLVQYEFTCVPTSTTSLGFFTDVGVFAVVDLFDSTSLLRSAM